MGRVELALATRPETTESVTRGAARLLAALGWAPLPEFPLPNGRRADLMALSPKGETQPAVATGDGVKEPLNRRSTININFAGATANAAPVASAPVPNP
jgi:hypothetical protein